MNGVIIFVIRDDGDKLCMLPVYWILLLFPWFWSILHLSGPRSSDLTCVYGEWLVLRIYE